MPEPTTPPVPESPPQPTPETPPTPAPVPTPAPPEPDPAALGEAGQRALNAEREARRDAERRAAEAEKERNELRKAQETETQRLQREAEDGRRLAQRGQTELRHARLLNGLGERGYVGPAALAVTRLLDSLEFDEANNPTNLDGRIEAARQMYGDQFLPVRATPPAGQPVVITGIPDPLRQGVRAPAPAVDEEAQFQAYMASAFPHIPQPTT